MNHSELVSLRIWICIRFGVFFSLVLTAVLFVVQTYLNFTLDL